jgi:hypothetical protein
LPCASVDETLCDLAKKSLIFDFSLHHSVASRYASWGAAVREDVVRN